MTLRGPRDYNATVVGECHYLGTWSPGLTVGVAPTNASYESPWSCTYTPIAAGLSELDVLLDGEHVDGSPYMVGRRSLALRAHSVCC